MSDPCQDPCTSSSRVSPPPVCQTSPIDAMGPMESPSYRIQRWIGGQDPLPAAMSPKARDAEEVRARRQHDHLAQRDWEFEEFEREMALRFVMRDLQLGLEELRGRTLSAGRARAEPPQTKMKMTQEAAAGRDRGDPAASPWLRTQSSTATLQPLTPQSPLGPPAPPSPSFRPATPSTSAISGSPAPAADSPRPFSLLSSRRSRASHRPALSELSLSSSHYTSSVSHDDNTSASVSGEAEAEGDPGPGASVRSLVSQFGHRIKYGLLSPPAHHSLSTSPTPKTVGAPPLMELSLPGAVRKRRRVSVPVSLAIGHKKRRLLVRGIRMDDEHAVEGIKRWACGLGEVSRICRTHDGTLWIEFRDRRVAENVCCLQAQVQIPHVGRVVLDWVEGRQPG